MNKIYIDITQSYTWQGEAMGIIRVMDEIAGRFIDHRSLDQIFVIWDERTASFHEVDYRQALDKRKANKGKSTSTLQKIEPAEKSSNVYATKGLVRSLAAKTPAAKPTYRFIVYQRDRARRFLAKSQSVEFENDAMLFMPHGGVWESEFYAKSILKLKQQKHIKLVPILYDLCPVLAPQFCSPGIRKVFNRHMRQLLPDADLILAISQSTKQDAQTWLKAIGTTSIPTIEVFRLGDEVGDTTGQAPESHLPNKFVLCVGTVEARKNHTSLYYAYKLAAQKGIELPSMVIVGRKGWLAEDIYEIITTDPRTKDKFIFLHDVDDDGLTWLYKNSQFLIYPSFYEGWGLPIAESLLRGLPCLASNTSSMPEIAGDLVDYFSPYSPEEIMRQIERLSTNPKLLSEKAKTIREKYKATSWNSSYQQVLDLISK